MQKNIITVIQESYPTFSKSQKLIADYIIHNYEKVAFMTAAKLAEKVKVSESTVVRFAAELGLEGYPELLRQLKEMVPTKLTSVQRIEIASSNLKEQDILKNVIHSDIYKLKQTLNTVDRNAFNQAVSSIQKAKKIYILGVRSAASLASFLGFYFNLMFENVKLIHTNSVSEMFEQLIGIGEDDVAIGISFPRYSRRTLKAMEFAQKSGAKVIAITDSNMSPLNKTADYSLIARSDMASFVDSLVAPLSLINALIVSLAMNKKEEMAQTFEKLERIWEEYQVYDVSQE